MFCGILGAMLELFSGTVKFDASRACTGLLAVLARKSVFLLKFISLLLASKRSKFSASPSGSVVKFKSCSSLKFNRSLLANLPSKNSATSAKFFSSSLERDSSKKRFLSYVAPITCTPSSGGQT